VSIGADCIIGCNVSLENCRVGDRCVVHSGVRIGQVSSTESPFSGRVC